MLFHRFYFPVLSLFYGCSFIRFDICHGLIRSKITTSWIAIPRGGCSTLYSSSHHHHHHLQKQERHDGISESSDPTYLAIITEPNACDDEINMDKTFEAIRRASSNQQVDIVSVRLTKTQLPDRLDRAFKLTQRLAELSKINNFKVVCSSDYIETAIKAKAHGIHVKEIHLSQIPEIRKKFASCDIISPLIGTSTHSVESAIKSFQIYQPDYYFVGTCYLTESHPEKSAEELEGPKLPGQVHRALLDLMKENSGCGSGSSTKVLAIGGIDETNCDEPILCGANGVATIRAVLQANDPAGVVSRLKDKMAGSITKSRRKCRNDLFIAQTKSSRQNYAEYY